MDDCELISFITAIACAIVKNCPEKEITMLAVTFTQLGDTLATVLAKRSLIEKEKENCAAPNNDTSTDAL